MRLQQYPGNEPDANDMVPEFDPAAENGAPETTPKPGEEEADALGDFA